MPAYSVEFLTEVAVSCFGGVMTNWASQPDYPLREKLVELNAFLGSLLATPRD